MLALKSGTLIDVDALRREAETLLECVAVHDMRATGAEAIYVLLPLEIGQPFSTHVRGWACRDLHLLFADVIQTRWRGPGPCVILDPVSIAEAFGDDADGFRESFLAVAFHELAHVCDFGFFDPRPPLDLTPEVIAATRAAVERQFRNVSPRIEMNQLHELNRGHGRRWLRSCCHVARRAMSVGLPNLLERTEGGSYPGGNPQYHSGCLEIELVACERWPISEILCQPEPVMFKRACNEDVLEIVRSLNPKEGQTMTQSILDRIKTALTIKADVDIQNYRQLVASICDGKEPSIDKTSAILREAGKNVNDLERDVERRRREWRRQFDEIPTLQQRLAEIDATAGKAEAKLRKAQEEYDSAMHPLSWESRQLQEKISKGSEARGNLIQNSETYVRQRQQTAEGRGHLIDRLQYQREIDRLRLTLAEAEGDSHPRIQDRVIFDARQRLKGMEAAMAASLEEQQRYDAEIAALEEAALDPEQD